MNRHEENEPPVDDRGELPAEDLFPADADDEGLSLEELGAAYAKVLAEADSGFAERLPPQSAPQQSGSDPADDAQPESASQPGQPDDPEEQQPVSIAGIIEAAVFVGHPANQPLTAKQIAGMIRNVSPREVEETVDELNASYAAAGQAIRILRQEGGLQMGLASELQDIQRVFYGKVREAHLSTAAVEVLALVAYQPGVTVQTIQDQRGKESVSHLNQLVRRQLLRVERVKPKEQGRAIATYYPTERFLELFNLDSLDDLPQVEEAGVVNNFESPAKKTD